MRPISCIFQSAETKPSGEASRSMGFPKTQHAGSCDLSELLEEKKICAEVPDSFEHVLKELTDFAQYPLTRKLRFDFRIQFARSFPHVLSCAFNDKGWETTVGVDQNLLQEWQGRLIASRLLLRGTSKNCPDLSGEI